ncbi:MAG: hypothetical protein ACRCWQ_02810 [Bacilli bacterium]
MPTDTLNTNGNSIIQSEDRKRFPKACKQQMFTRTEEVWIRVVESTLKSGGSALQATDFARHIANTFTERFGE